GPPGVPRALKSCREGVGTPPMPPVGGRDCLDGLRPLGRGSKRNTRAARRGPAAGREADGGGLIGRHSSTGADIAGGEGAGGSGRPFLRALWTSRRAVEVRARYRAPLPAAGCNPAGRNRLPSHPRVL